MRAARSTSQLLHLTAILLIGLNLAGCVSISIDPVHMDSLSPTVPGVPICAAVEGKPIGLKPNQSCLALARAKDWWSVSNVIVGEKQHYAISIPAGQFWWDEKRRSDPALGDKGSTLMNLFAHKKRLTEDHWFVLVATVVDCGDAGKTTAPLLRHYDAKELCAETMQKAKAVKNGVELTTVAPGRLALFANDAPGFYWNNAGQVWVVIKRMVD